MKKRSVDTEVVGLIDKMQQQLAALEKKIDILISHSSQKPASSQPAHKPFQQHGNSSHNVQRSHGNNYAQRVLHKAVCADCKKECEVPFKPTGDRPVYCKDCFSKRKAGVSTQFKHTADNRPGAVAASQAAHIARPEPAPKKKSAEKKKPAAKKKKSKAK